MKSLSKFIAESLQNGNSPQINEADIDMKDKFALINIDPAFKHSKNYNQKLGGFIIKTDNNQDKLTTIAKKMNSELTAVDRTFFKPDKYVVVALSMLNESLDKAKSKSIAKEVVDRGWIAIADIKRSKDSDELLDRIYTSIENFIEDQFDGGEAKSILSNIEQIGSDAKAYMMTLPEYNKFKVVQESRQSIKESNVSSDSEFKEYVDSVLKAAFGDDFDQNKADKTAEGILKDADGDYGKAVGILQGSLK